MLVEMAVIAQKLKPKHLVLVCIKFTQQIMQVCPDSHHKCAYYLVTHLNVQYALFDSCDRPIRHYLSIYFAILHQLSSKF